MDLLEAQYETIKGLEREFGIELTNSEKSLIRQFLRYTKEEVGILPITSQIRNKYPEIETKVIAEHKAAGIYTRLHIDAAEALFLIYMLMIWLKCMIQTLTIKNGSDKPEQSV